MAYQLWAIHFLDILYTWFSSIIVVADLDKYFYHYF